MSRKQGRWIERLLWEQTPTTSVGASAGWSNTVWRCMMSWKPGRERSEIAVDRAGVMCS